MSSTDTSAAADSPMTSSSTMFTSSSSNLAASASTPGNSTPAGRTPEKSVPQNASFEEEFGFEMVKISVGTGPAMRHFHIHKKLLCQKAPVFDRMFSKQFAEGLSGEANLPEDIPKAFGMFASWLYKGSLTSPCGTDCPDKEVVAHHHGDYIDLFIFAEKYRIVQLADNTLDAYIEYQIATISRPSMHRCTQAYEGTHEGSKLRLYISRYWAYTVLNKEHESRTSSSLVPTGEHACGFILDGIILLRNLNNVKREAGKKLIENPKFAPSCDYHQHGKDEVCPYAKQNKRKLDESN